MLDNTKGRFTPAGKFDFDPLSSTKAYFVLSFSRLSAAASVAAAVGILIFPIVLVKLLLIHYKFSFFLSLQGLHIYLFEKVFSLC